MPGRVFSRLSGVLIALFLMGVVQADAEAPADLVFHNGPVYTADDEHQWARAVAVRTGRIHYVGDSDGVTSLIGPDTRVVDLAGRMLMPGFHDSHMHPMRAGTRFLRCQLGGLEWPGEVLEKLRACESALEPGQWLRATELTDDAFDGQGPDKTILDEIAPHRPALVSNRTGYLSWVNTHVLKLAGIDRDTPDPEKGLIERRAVTGEPRGVLREMAIGLVYPLASRYSQAEYREALRLASTMANRFGITSVNAAKIWPENWQAYVTADKAGELTLRVQASLNWNFSKGLGQLEKLEQLRDGHAGPRFRADAVKLTLDGNISQATASLIDPYAGTGSDFGLPNVTAQILNETVAALDAGGFQVHIHAVGDRIVRLALDAFEHTMSVNGPRDRRHQIAHIPLIHPPDLPRFAELGITADFQPLWAYLDTERKVEIGLLGEERGSRLMGIKSMFDSGALVVAGSDWISESMNPLYSIQIAITRRPPDGSAPAWVPEERVTLEQMLTAYTINGAWLARQEHETGSIEVGKSADLIMLEHNLFEVDPMELKDVKVLLTLLEGKTVYQDPAFEP